VTYRLEIRPDALADIEAAAEWYEAREPDLGANFARTVLEAIDSLPNHPLIYRVRERRQNVRWFRPPRFPHRIVYRVQEDLITVLAVVHMARHEREWRRRL
jgi:plasmid stabilization system protein ParE